jgi:hypothetical protein
MKYKFELEKIAKSTGGDKYICHDLRNFNIYMPQAISRESGKPAEVLYIEVSNENN